MIWIGLAMALLVFGGPLALCVWALLMRDVSRRRWREEQRRKEEAPYQPYEL